MDRIKAAAWLGLLAVGLGAFGAHGLAKRLEETGHLEAWKTAVLYHMFHVVALLVVGILQRGGPGQQDAWARLAPWAFTGGILLFSGSLYVLALTDIKGFGAVTPVGGFLFILGWAGLALGSTEAS